MAFRVLGRRITLPWLNAGMPHRGDAKGPIDLLRARWIVFEVVFDRFLYEIERILYAIGNDISFQE
jgi:hypothetical protein